MAVGSLLGEWIETVRVARGQTRDEAAAEIGISCAGICLVVARRQRGRALRSREGLARYLGVDPEVVDLLADMPCGARRGVVTDARVQGQLSRLGQRIEAVRLRRRMGVYEMAGELGVHHDSLLLARKVRQVTRRSPSLATIAEAMGLGYDEAVALAAEPAAPGPAWPVTSWVGTKRTPLVPARSCEQCAFARWCQVDDLAGDYAWCEDVAPVDFEASESSRN